MDNKYQLVVITDDHTIHVLDFNVETDSVIVEHGMITKLDELGNSTRVARIEESSGIHFVKVVHK